MRLSDLSPSARAQATKQGAVETKRKHKFGAIPTEVDGIRFASKLEALVYSGLKLRELMGEISDLTLQPRYPLVVLGEKVATYVGDFQYSERGRIVCMDAKGMKTPVYNIKIKLARLLYPNVQFREATR